MMIWLIGSLVLLILVYEKYRSAVASYPTYQQNTDLIDNELSGTTAATAPAWMNLPEVSPSTLDLNNPAPSGGDP